MHTNITKNVENTRIFQILFYIYDNNDNKDDDMNNKCTINPQLIIKYKIKYPNGAKVDSFDKILLSHRFIKVYYKVVEEE